MPGNRPTRSSLAVMVLGVVVLHVGVTAVMLFAGTERWSSPTFAVARAVLPVHGWAAVFAVIALIMTAGVTVDRAQIVARGSVLGAGLCTFWAVLLILAAERSPTAGLLGVVLFLSAACSHVAVSIAAGLLPGGR